MPDWQDGPGVHSAESDASACGLSSGSCREVPDTSLGVDPTTGYPIYSTTYGPCGGIGWQAVGGTSAAAPRDRRA